MAFCYAYPRPPFQDKWAFPGGFVDMYETLEEAVVRELQEETGILLTNLKQFKTYSAVNRDPRGRTISVVFTGTLPEIRPLNAQDDAVNAKFFSITELPNLAFDHKEILEEILT